MPLVAHNALPTFDRLRRDGMTVLETGRAAQQEIRELHVGLLNMMPDAALEATERQFYRLVGESNPIAQFYMHPFTLPTLPRGEAAQAHIAQFYESFDAIRAAGLDALIITGANVSHANLADEPFWAPLIEVIDWAWDNVTSTLCSCLATHAVMQFRHGQARVKQPKKIWGVFEHRVTDSRHPLVADVNTRFDVPHSRWNDVSRAQFEAAGVKVLVESAEAGVHLAVSHDGLRTVFFQGHPEYDTISLLKEYKRDLLLAAAGKLPAAACRRARRWLSPKRACCRCSTTPGTTPPRRWSATGSAASTRSPTANAACLSCRASIPIIRWAWRDRSPRAL